MRWQHLFLVAAFVAQANEDIDDDDFERVLGGEGEVPPVQSAPLSFDMPMGSEPALDVKYTHMKLPFKAPVGFESALIAETFQSKEFPWTKLTSGQYAGNEWQRSLLDEDMEEDYGLMMPQGMKYYGMANKLKGTWSSEKEDRLYGSLEVKFGEKHTCGGAYFKLFDSSKISNKLDTFDGQTSYSIMFGPDICGFSNSKVHLIVQRDTGSSQRDEFAVKKIDLPTPVKGALHQYGFELEKKTGQYKVYVDGAIKAEGQMTEDFTDGFRSKDMIDDPTDIPPEDWTPPPSQIPDPEAQKPDDWDESQPEMIPDTETPMPEGWLVDEPLQVPNPDAVKPEDWNDEEDGVWMVPKMRNPKCEVGCGPWEPTKPNPEYKGKWAASMIPNPDYTPEYPRRQIPHPHPFDYSTNPFGAIESFNSIGFELWTVEDGTTVDNVFISTNKQQFHDWLASTWEPKSKVMQENSKRRAAAEEESAKAGPKTGGGWTTHYAVGAGLAIVAGLAVMARRRKPVVPAATPAAAPVQEKKAESAEKETEADSETVKAQGESKPEERKKPEEGEE